MVIFTPIGRQLRINCKRSF